jgi:[acyl-carrier-protein] S-malonyltransferase
MGKVAFIFPGQGSQKVGMGRALADRYPEAKAVFDQVDSALGEQLSRLCFEGPEDALKLTSNTQPAILTVSAAATAVLSARGVVPDVVAGHSLGEYSALVAAGAISPADAAKIVRTRGILMQQAVPTGLGAMAAVLGLAPEQVAACCAEVAAATGKVCAPANFNEPGQTVIAGDAGAVEVARAKLMEAGAKKVMPLPVSAPFHCALMSPVKSPLEAALRGVAWKAPRVPVVTNVEAKPNQDLDRIVSLLVEQVTSPVRWIECAQEMVRLGVTRAVEIGPGKVLASLMKRIDRSVQVLNVEDDASLESTLQVLRGG